MEKHEYCCINPNLGQWSVSQHRRLTPDETTPGTRCIGSWVVPRAGLELLKKKHSFLLPGDNPGSGSKLNNRILLVYMPL